MTGLGHNGGPALETFKDRLNNGNAGWVRIERKMRDHPLVGFGHPVAPMNPELGALSRAEAWIDLIMECHYEPGVVINAGRKMLLQPGELVGAVSWLASRWNWTPKTVRVFLDKLADESMIVLATQAALDAKGKQEGEHRGKQRGKQATVLSVCNYSEYQIIQQPEGQARGRAQGQAQGQQYKDNNSKQVVIKPPTPLGGDSLKASARLKPKGITESQWKATDLALTSWNALAMAHGLSVVRSFTMARRQRMAKRLADIGGNENFDLALTAVPLVPFLMGKVPPRPGEAPFQLDIDRLLQTDGKLGDVLAKLIDKAGEKNTQSRLWWQDPEVVARVTAEQWRELVAKHAFDTWNVRELGPPPGSDRCVVPRHIIQEMGLTDKFDRNGLARGAH